MGYLDQKFKWKTSLGLQQMALFGKIMEPLRGGPSLEEVRHWWVGLKNLCPGSTSCLLTASEQQMLCAWSGSHSCLACLLCMLPYLPYHVGLYSFGTISQSKPFLTSVVYVRMFYNGNRNKTNSREG